jgi:PAS domain-containing protein
MATRLARDIEAEEAAERGLRSHAELQESILDNIGDGVLVLSSGRRALVINPTARKFLPLVPDQMMPANWSTVCQVHLPDGTTVFPAEQKPERSPGFRVA